MPESGPTPEKAVKFPKHITFRGRALATIYRPSKSYSNYRVAWTVNGKRMMKGFHRYGDAKGHADQLVKDLAKGSQVTALTPGQANDALAAFERLHGFFVATGRRISLLGAVSEWAESAAKLGGRSITEAVDGFLGSVATVKRLDLGKAIEEFIAHRKAKTVADAGKRPRLSPEQFYLTSLWLREFAAAFPGHAVNELTKQHLDLYMGRHAKAAPKTRNERRAMVRMFLKWAAVQDYVAANHRLLEATEMQAEDDEPEEIEIYTAGQMRAMLERAARPPQPAAEGQRAEADYRKLLPVVALAGLAGLRFTEICRLVWDDVFRIPGHLEVKAAKSKTRSRRLIPICDALGAWLEPFRTCAGPVWVKGYDMLHEDFGALRRALEIPDRRNGLRHAFISAHFAAHSDEGLTAAQAGNSPDVIHRHYKQLMTRQEGEAWFAVAAPQAANIIPLQGAAAAQGA